MEKELVLTDVPSGVVEQVIQDFTSDGATTVAKERQPDGNWTVRASFGDPREQ